MKTFLTVDKNTRISGPNVSADSFDEAQTAIEFLYGDQYSVVGELLETYPVDPLLIEWLVTPNRVSDNVCHVAHCEYQ